MNERKGFVVERDGRLYVRIQWTDNLGKRRELMRRANDRKHARELKKQLVKQLDSADAEQRLAAEKTTFREIAKQYKAQNLIEAQYVGERKVAGRRSLQSPLHWLQLLIEHFGNARLRSITHSAVDAYRLKRLNEGLEISSVNRELELLRAILNYAKREGLINLAPKVRCLLDDSFSKPLSRPPDVFRATVVQSTWGRPFATIIKLGDWR